MNGPKRLLDDGATELGRAALRSALDEPPPDHLLERTLATVAASAGILAASAGAAQAAAAATGASKAGVSSWVWFLAKCLGAGVGGGAVVVAAVELAAPPPPPAPTRGVESAALAAGTHAARGAFGAPAPAATEPSVVAPPPEEPAAVEGQTARGSAPGATAPSASAPGRAGIAAEIALLDAARTAQTSGNHARALSLLDQYATEFPAGGLAAEAEVLRIDVLAARGDRAVAAERARRFLQRHPNSPHAERLRRIAEPSP
jgi:TolA-binding protein